MEKGFQHYMLVRQEHLNQYGSLFGGRVLSVIDELAFIACARTYPGRNFVTRMVEDAAFTAPAKLGDVLEFTFGIQSVGRTSVWVEVAMLIHEAAGGGGPSRSFDGRVLMVCVDAAGNAVPVAKAR